MALAKIVGFVVIPLTCQTSTSSLSEPSVSRVRLRSSSQIETPASVSRSSLRERSICSSNGMRGARGLIVRRLLSLGVEDRSSSPHDGLRRDAELAVERRLVGGGPEVVEPDAAP